jgi:hypothetical protein
MTVPIITKIPDGAGRTKLRVESEFIRAHISQTSSTASGNTLL